MKAFCFPNPPALPSLVNCQRCIFIVEIIELEFMNDPWPASCRYSSDTRLTLFRCPYGILQGADRILEDQTVSGIGKTSTIIGEQQREFGWYFWLAQFTSINQFALKSISFCSHRVLRNRFVAAKGGRQVQRKAKPRRSLRVRTWQMIRPLWIDCYII